MKASILKPKGSSSYSQNIVADQGYTYNEPGLTYNEAGVMYGGVDRRSSSAPFNERALITKSKNSQANIK